ncbi:spore germination protein [Mechercharimyces sp. CAU 1602]|uniref:spore germination protein n=1 Tax=Mechercharimyces sp. CAU 1602 TaxID=2973933 RepID=UPI002162753D|nr:spore germination protein [Mechercharimyces sp. CAU 1602]MCS1351413.1 spore germination protein [Mechercharimyces sp. CAU 1602]
MPSLHSPHAQPNKNQAGFTSFKQIAVSSSLTVNSEHVYTILGKSSDLVERTFTELSFPFTLFYLDTLTDEKQLNRAVISPLLDWQTKIDVSTESLPLPDVINHLELSQIKTATSFDHIASGLTGGSAVLFLEGSTKAYLLPLFNGASRSVNEPQTQTMIRGPRDGFVENLNTNLSLVRERIKNPSLRIQAYRMGRLSEVELRLLYIEGQVHPHILSEVKDRLKQIQSHNVLESNMVEELLHTGGYSPFPRSRATERPDVSAAALMEGRIVIMLEGSPFCIILPVTFFSFFQAAEDYYQHFDMSTFVRFLRIAAFFVTLSLPSFYVAITTYHQEVIETGLLINLAAQREGVPFPALMEAVLMEIIFEMLREAGVRMPRPIGPAISIVGAIVIGESAVNAGLVSPAMVMVVALTAIASFVSPYYEISNAARLLRFAMLGFAATIGLFGMMFFMLGLLIHLCSLQSFGQPYFSPMAPFHIKQQKDTLLRFPLWWQNIHPLKSLRKLVP